MVKRKSLGVGPNDRSVTILGIVGSPRKGNTEIMVSEALGGAREVGNVNTRVFTFYGKEFQGCLATCRLYCKQHGKCALRDDFHKFLEAWLDADGIIFGAPVFHMGPPGQVKAAIDRLGNVLSAHLGQTLPRFSKVSAALVQGGTRWGGQEITLQFFVQHFLVMKCLPISGDLPDSYIGVAGVATPSIEPDSLLRDTVALRAARNVGRRVAEMTRIVQAGIDVLGNDLPDDYRFSRSGFVPKTEATRGR